MGIYFIGRIKVGTDKFDQVVNITRILWVLFLYSILLQVEWFLSVIPVQAGILKDLDSHCRENN